MRLISQPPAFVMNIQTPEVQNERYLSSPSFWDDDLGVKANAEFHANYDDSAVADGEADAGARRYPADICSPTFFFVIRTLCVVLSANAESSLVPVTGRTESEDGDASDVSLLAATTTGSYPGF